MTVNSQNDCLLLFGFDDNGGIERIAAEVLTVNGETAVEVFSGNAEAELDLPCLQDLPDRKAIKRHIDLDKLAVGAAFTHLAFGWLSSP